jgi:predicted nuclease with TOPRIM domain
VEAIRKKYSGSKQKLKEMEDELANLLAENNELRSSLEQTNEQLQQKE